MAATHQKLLSALVFFSAILYFHGSSSAQECPYPCYPPPTGTGNNNPPLTTTPPATPAGGTEYPPPAFYSPPAGVLPYFPPPGGISGVTPPPPDQIVPWFPFYSRKPPHPELSSSPALRGSLKAVIFTISFLAFSLCSVLLY